MNKFAALLPLVLLAAAAAVGQAEEDAAAERAARIAPFLDEATFAVARVDLSRLDAASLVSRVSELAPVPPEQVALLAGPLREWLEQMSRAGAQELFFVFTTATWGGLREGVVEPIAVVPLEAGADAAEIARLLGPESLLGFGATAKVNGAVVASGERGLEHVRNLAAEGRPELAAALAAAGDAPLQLLVIPSRAQRRIFEEVFYELPQEIGGGPGSMFTNGFHWAALGINPGPERSLHLVIQSRDADAAQALHEKIARIYEVLAASKDVQKVVSNFAGKSTLVTPAVDDDRLVLALDDKAIDTLVADILQPAVVAARGAATRQQCMNNMRQLALAILLYNDKHKLLPAAASYDAAGKPLLSWRVHVLPFLEQQSLYNEFHLDEPWDSPHNRTLTERMPEVFRCPTQRTAPGHTCYLAPIGERTVFPPGQAGIKFDDVRDGTAGTVLFVDVDDDHAVIWTKPEDLNYDPQEPLRGLIGHHVGGFNVVFVDAHNKFLSQSVDLNALRAVFTRNGAEIIAVTIR